MPDTVILDGLSAKSTGSVIFYGRGHRDTETTLSHRDTAAHVSRYLPAFTDQLSSNAVLCAFILILSALTALPARQSHPHLPRQVFLAVPSAGPSASMSATRPFTSAFADSTTPRQHERPSGSALAQPPRSFMSPCPTAHAHSPAP